MCFSGELSVFFAVFATATSALLWIRKRPAWAVGLLLYFAVMEMLQALHYVVIEEACPHPDGHAPNAINQALMLLSYIHICFQPLVINWFSFGVQTLINPSRPGIHQVKHAILGLSAAFAVLMLIKGLPAMGLPEEAIPWPARLCTAGTEIMCGDVQGGGCGVRGRFHLAWKMRLLETGYYIPGFSLHFFLFFMPTLVICDWSLKALFTLLLVTGPFVVEWLTYGDRDANMFEAPGIWCFFSVVQCLVALGWELVVVPLLASKHRSGKGRKQQ